jgi:hypothetical protein
VLADVELGIPISRLETSDFDLAGFCVERIRQLLD